MKHKRYITLTIFVLIFILFVTAYEVKVRSQIRDEHLKSLTFVKEAGGRIYCASSDLYVLDPNTGVWLPYSFPSHISSGDYQDTAIRSNKIVFYDYNDYIAKMISIKNVREIQHFPEIKTLFGPCDLSMDNTKLAYFAHHHPDDELASLVIFDLKSREKKHFPDIRRVDSVSWLYDNTTLVASVSRKIIKLDIITGNKEDITSGYWGKVLSKNTFSYWRHNEGFRVCYKMDIITKDQEEIFRTKHFLLGYDWDPSERYLLLSTVTRTHGFLIFDIPKYALMVFDTKTKEKYWLPKTSYAGGFYTGTIWWLPD